MTQNKTFNRGGQRRTIDFPCGFRLQGHPNELGLKTKLHTKTCEYCKSNATHTDTNPFNKTHAKANGWDGLAGDKIVVQDDKMMTVTTDDGKGIEAKYKDLRDLDDIVGWINKKN